LRKTEGRRIGESSFAKASADKSENQKSEVSKLVKKSEVAGGDGERLKSEPPIVESKVVEQQQPEIEITGQVPVSLAEVESFWPKVIAKVKEINGPLASMLKNSPLAAVEGTRIILSVKFAFDKQSLENLKNSSLICECIEQVAGKKMAIAGMVLKPEAQPGINPAEVIGEALKVFGGELVE